MRPPTPNQSARLLSVADGQPVLFPRRSEWMPLVRNGWMGYVEERPASPRGGFLAPIRITADGRRIALAEWSARVYERGGYC